MILEHYNTFCLKRHFCGDVKQIALFAISLSAGKESDKKFE